MSTTRKVLFYSIIVVGTLLILATLLSLLYDIQLWYLKALDFPRLQVLIGLLLCITGFLFINPKWRISSTLFMIGLLSSIILQATFIVPYTPLTEKAVPDATDANSEIFTLLLANVLMKNQKVDEFLTLAQDASADMILAMETDQMWIDQLAPLKNEYQYVVEYPLDNTYGIALYSKLPLTNTDIKFYGNNKVPSIVTDVNLNNGESFKLFAIHPVPPKPSKHPDNIGEEEVAIVKVGKEVVKSNKPVIVAGDFNDVAWSNTSRLFGRSSKLSDVRIGRGLYNSFDAKSLIMRWPLDHVYLSSDFAIKDIRKLPTFGSDHFPLLFEISL